MVPKERQLDIGIKTSRETELTVGQVLSLLGTPEQVTHALSEYKKPKTDLIRGLTSKNESSEFIELEVQPVIREGIKWRVESARDNIVLR